MSFSIVPIRDRHVPGFHKVLDRVAREKRYLAMFVAPPLRETRKFVRQNIESRNPQFVALADREVVGWCDIIRSVRDTSKHCGVLGLGVAAEIRGKGIGRRLMKAAIDAAWKRRFTRIELTVREDN